MPQQLKQEIPRGFSLTLKYAAQIKPNKISPIKVEIQTTIKKCCNETVRCALPSITKGSSKPKPKTLPTINNHITAPNGILNFRMASSLSLPTDMRHVYEKHATLSNQLRLFNFLRRRGERRAIGGFGILEDFAFVVAQHHAVGVVA